jgi:uncharacterized protein (DUF1800 family)
MHVEETMAVSVSDRIIPASPANPASPARPAQQDLASPASKTALASASALAAALLAACGGGGGGTGSVVAGSTSEPQAAPGFNNYPKAQSDEEAARFLMQSQFAVTDGGLSAVRSATFAAKLQQDFASPQGQTGWDWLEQRGYGVSDTNRYFFTEYPADFMIWNQLFTAPDTLRKRIALALSEFFVVSLQTAEYQWRSHAIAHYWDTLVKNAFGNYRQLLEDITLNPAMGWFLNTKGNQKENTATGRVPDENYGREVMQLFTIGLVQLNPDGTEKTGANGAKLETYTQDDVTNIARVFTGYDFDTSDGVRVQVLKDAGGVEPYTIESRDFARKPMKFDATRHSTLAATFLGTTIPANTAGPAALKTALDTLFNHPNTAPFFARQMIQRLVTSNPSPAYVARVSAAFANNGAGVRGDLKAVWTAILLDDEARNPAKAVDPAYGKLREPMLRLVQWGRSFGIGSAAGSWKMFDTNGAADKLGQSPLRSPSVFNFFRPGFVPPNTALAKAQAPAPEFQLVNETTVGGYINYMQGVIRDGIYCPEPTVPQAAYRNYIIDVTASYASELSLAVGDATALVRRLNLILCAGQMSAANQNLIIAALNGTPVTASSTAAQKLDRVAAGVLLVMASADYLIQR